MKKYIAITLIMLGCNLKETNKQKNIEIESKNSNVRSEKKELKKFYECDKIEHFYLNISEAKVYDIWHIENKTDDEIKLMQLLNMSYPLSMNEDHLESNLIKFKFVKTVLNKKEKIEVEKVFTQKDSTPSSVSSCVPFYRDVFLFKKNDSLIGIAKVCFGCGISQFRGSKVETDGFGLRTDLEKLEKIIRKK